MRYTYRQGEVEAFRYGEDLWPDWFREGLEAGRYRLIEGDEYVIPGCMIDGERPQFAAAGDWVVRHPDGEVEAMPSARFDARFEPKERPRRADVVTVEVPGMLAPAYGDEVTVELHFHEGLCYPVFRSGERHRVFRDAFDAALEAAEAFGPLTPDQAAALARRVITERLTEARRIRIDR